MTSSPYHGDTAQWMRTGAGLFAAAVDRCMTPDLGEASLLPGWSRAFVISHVSANAQAIGRLLHWARTGEPTPMYASMEERDSEIAQGAALSLVELTEWYTRSDLSVQQAFTELPEAAWANRVVTAQGREIPASETLWMRSREVCIHAVDMNMGITFADLPTGFLARLADEASARHSTNPELPAVISVTTDDSMTSWHIGEGDADIEVTGTLPDVVSWLSGRGAGELHTTTGQPIPPLPKWL